MKKKLLTFAMAAFLLFSCSDDKDDTGNAANGIVGTWDLTALEIDESTATDDEEFARDILAFLSAVDCTILTYTFNEDGSVISENSGNYLEINVNQGGTGLDIPCPVERDMEEDTYTIEGGVLTYIDDSGAETVIEVSVTGNTIMIGATELGIDNFDSGGTLVFTRR